jgi:hypothetical protein
MQARVVELEARLSDSEQQQQQQQPAPQQQQSQLSLHQMHDPGGVHEDSLLTGHKALHDATPRTNLPVSVGAAATALTATAVIQTRPDHAASTAAAAAAAAVTAACHPELGVPAPGVDETSTPVTLLAGNSQDLSDITGKRMHSAMILQLACSDRQLLPAVCLDVIHVYRRTCLTSAMSASARTLGGIGAAYLYAADFCFCILLDCLNVRHREDNASCPSI